MRTLTSTCVHVSSSSDEEVHRYKLVLVLPDDAKLEDMRDSLQSSALGKDDKDVFFPSWNLTLIVKWRQEAERRDGDEDEASEHEIYSEPETLADAKQLNDALDREQKNPGTLCILLQQCRNKRYSRSNKKENRTVKAPRPTAAANLPTVSHLGCSSSSPHRHAQSQSSLQSTARQSPQQVQDYYYTFPGNDHVDNAQVVHNWHYYNFDPYAQGFMHSHTINQAIPFVPMRVLDVHRNPGYDGRVWYPHFVLPHSRSSASYNNYYNGMDYMYY